MPRQRYSVAIGDEPFEFDWDKDTSPTQDDILGLYKASKTPKKGAVRRAWDFATTPLAPQIAENARKDSDRITAPSLNQSPTMARVKGFIGGAIEGAGNLATQMTSPLDLAATATGLGAVRRVATTPFKVASALTGARGAQNIYEGLNPSPNLTNVITEKEPGTDWGKVGAGGLETALSLLGVRSPVPAKKPLLGVDPKLTQINTMPPANAPIRNPARLLPAAPRFVAGEAGVADTGRNYSAILGNEIIPRSPESIAASGAVPEVLPKVKRAYSPVGVSGTIETLASEAGDRTIPKLGAESSGTYGYDQTNRMFPSVPGRMQTGTNQQVTDALAGRRVSAPERRINTNYQMADRLEDVNTDVTPLPGRVLSEPIVSPTIKKLAASSDPIIKKAAQEVVAANPAPAPAKGGVVKNAKRMAEEWLYKPMLSVIKEDSEAGGKIGRMMEKAYADYSTWAGQTSNKITKLTEGLSKEELENLPFAIQGKAVPLNSRVQNVMNGFKEIDNQFMERATKAGLKMRTASGKTVPFTAQDDYWARIYPDEFIKQRAGDIKKDMLAKGMAPEEIDDILANSRAFGNRLIDPQHGRKADVEGYRLDVDSQKHHYSDLARRIVEAENFGNMDTADASSPISTLLKGTKDYERVKGLVDQYLGREGGGKGYVQDVANAVNKFQVAVQLPLFAIKNQSQKAMIPIKGNIAEFASALKKYTTKEGRDIAENTGAYQSIRDIIHEMGGESKISKYYGISKTEEGNRGLAAITGKGTAARLFGKLKAKPNDKIAREQLDELLLEDVDTVLKQDTLTDAQMNRAGFRMAELTQGSANPMNLPSKWSEHPETKILTLYKRFALQQSKLIKDTIMQDWKKNLPTALIALTAAGEITGDVHKGVTSLAQGKDAGEEIAKRGEDNPVGYVMGQITGDKDVEYWTGRVARDLADSMALGILQDFIESGGSRTQGLASFLMGPTVDKAGKLMYGASESVRKGSVKPVAKEVIKAVTPVPLNIPAANMLGEDKPKRRGLGY